jgi:hypothetical protein
VFLKLALLPITWKFELFTFLLMRRFIAVRKMRLVMSSTLEDRQEQCGDESSLGCPKIGRTKNSFQIFKAQVKLRFTSAFNKWKFLSIYLSQVFQISD